MNKYTHTHRDTHTHTQTHTHTHTHTETHTHTHSLHMSDITPPTLYTHCPTYIAGYGNTKLYSNTRSYSTFDTHSCIHTTIHPNIHGGLLLSQGHCKHQVLGDGNCLFSYLSHQLYGTVEYYSQLYWLVQLIEKNDSTYQKYWIKRMDWGNVTFGDHMQQVKNNWSWGTLVELQASSDYFSVPIYVWLKEPIRIVQWEKKAIPWNQNYVTTSTCALPHPIFPFTMHLELAFESHHSVNCIRSNWATEVKYLSVHVN